MLPLVFFTTMGDNFRLFVVFLWAFIPVFIALLIHHTYPQYSTFRSIPIIIPISIISLFLFLINLMYYYPFHSSLMDSPIESAAVILTSHLLFSATVVFTFLIIHLIFSDEMRAIIGTISVICCSSLLYWATSAKDHMLSIFIVTLILYLFARYSHNKSYNMAAGGFFLCGILVWTRPELGFTVFFCCFTILSGTFYYPIVKKGLEHQKMYHSFMHPFFCYPWTYSILY